MSLPGRQLIAKAVFAVAIVAATATAGVVGFAQAAPSPAATTDNGYGGGIPRLIEALREFRQEVLRATREYRHDVNACLDGTQTAMSQKGTLRTLGAEGQFEAAKGNFNQRLDKTLGGLNERLGDGRNAQGGKNALDGAYKSAANDAVTELNNAQGLLAADLGQATTPASDGGLFDCLDQARDKYKSALDAAKEKLLAVIREILG